MFKYRNVATILAVSSLAALPACSMFGGGRSNQQASYPSQSYASSSPSSYGSSSSSTNYSNAPTGQQPELTQNTTRQVQQELQQDGMYKGQVDGVWGPQTKSAVRQYQQKNNLSATGQLDSQTLASLNVGGQGGQSSYNTNGMNNGSAASSQGSQRYSNTSPSNGNMSSSNMPTSTGATNPQGSQGGNAGGGGTNGQSTH